MRHQLITNTPVEWAQNTDIVSYGKRQAQSCTYLEKLFDEVEDKSTELKLELSDLFGYLRRTHRIQRSDLEQLTHIPIVEKRDSFYFDNLYSAFNLSTSELPEAINREELLTILSIQAVSYLRGQDRYHILKEYNVEENNSFQEVWKDFYGDATNNAKRVFNFIYDHFDETKAKQRIIEVIQAEDDLLQTILEYKNDGPTQKNQ